MLYKRKLFFGIVFCGSFLIITNCKKEDPKPEPEPASLPSVNTSPVSSITETSAISGGDVTFEGNPAIIAVGVCWDTMPNPTTLKSHSNNGATVGKYQSKLVGLKANTTYYLRAYATNGTGTAYGSELSFKTASDYCGSVTYLNDIKPIFDQNCLACHGSLNPVSGVDLSTYEKLKAKAEQGRVEARVIHHNPSPMPPTGSLAQAQIDLISCWLKNGYKQ